MNQKGAECSNDAHYPQTAITLTATISARIYHFPASTVKTNNFLDYQELMYRGAGSFADKHQ